MYITLETDYAVRIVSYLADCNRRVDAKEIADKICVTHRYVLKIARNLCTAGIIKSYKGADGGYALAKSPSEITLLDILEAIEGPYKFSRCLNDPALCSRNMSGRCCFQCAFSEITDKVTEMLSQYTIENLHCKRK